MMQDSVSLIIAKAATASCLLTLLLGASVSIAGGQIRIRHQIILALSCSIVGSSIGIHEQQRTRDLLNRMNQELQQHSKQSVARLEPRLMQPIADPLPVQTPPVEAAAIAVIPPQPPQPLDRPQPIEPASDSQPVGFNLAGNWSPPGL